MLSRRWIKLWLLLFVVVVLSGVGMLIDHLFNRPPKPAAITDVRFPVIVAQPDGGTPFLAETADELSCVMFASQRQPLNGTVLIDSNLNLFVEQNVKSDDNDLKQLFRTFVRPRSTVQFHFDLVHGRESGLAAAIKQLQACKSLPCSYRDFDRLHAALADQTSMAGIIDLLDLAPKPPPEGQAAP